MADEFFLDEGAYDGIMSDLEATGHKFGENYRDLTAVLTQYDGAWGGDDIGKAFEKKYIEQGQVVEALTMVEGGEKNLVDSANSGKKSARNFAGLDNETAARIDSTVTSD